ncbi:MAG: hypothetical protein L6R42_006032 [Xanthoria sp. 1 TBL-2021]|nr:MAG: hypothetical protein L6R42_006032 [Xanthoria sp. 1 TBL-2021]
MTESQEDDWQRPEYEYQEDVERLSNYRPGGYHPVNLGDDYCDGRYIVVNKLGFGTYSTVWLAKDRSNDRYVALKILDAEASVSCNEASILRHLEARRTYASGAVGEECVSKLLDVFDIDGPNGRHQCLVSEPAACSITYSKDLSIVWVFPLQVARAIAAKVIMGVHYLHNSDVVHGESSYAKLPPPETEPIRRFDGAPLSTSVPSHAVPAIQCGEACEDTTDANVLISDFGEAYLATGPPPPYLHTPYEYCPPEPLLNRTPPTTPPPNGKATDIWTLACTLVKILGRSPLFGGACPDADDVMAEIISALGLPPPEIWTSWAQRAEFFDDDGNWDIKPPRRHASFSRPLEQRIAHRMKAYGGNLTEEEKEALARMLRGMLAYEPERRWTIERVLGCEWMEGYGRPAIGELDGRVDGDGVVDTGILKMEPEVYRKVVWVPEDVVGESDVVWSRASTEGSDAETREVGGLG